MNFTGFNTSTLGYSLISGKLKEKRKHSEQLYKYIAGLFDGDGTVAFDFYKEKSTENRRATLVSNIVSSQLQDCDSTLLIKLKEYTGLGFISYKPGDLTAWVMKEKDSMVLFNRIGKHLRIKGTHFENLIWVVNELKGVSLTDKNTEELKEFSKCSRRESKWLKQPKHPSWAWLAGLLDADGYYKCRLGRRRLNRHGNISTFNELGIALGLQSCDKHIPYFVKNALGGNVCYSTTDDTFKWQINLGSNSVLSALRILGNLRKYSCLKYKYLLIERMLNFHEIRRAQRLSKDDPMRISDSLILETQSTI